MHQAVRSGRSSIVKLALVYGVDIFAKSDGEKTAFDEAKDMGQSEVIAVLDSFLDGPNEAVKTFREGTRTQAGTKAIERDKKLGREERERERERERALNPSCSEWLEQNERELERAGENWRELERTGENWRELRERPGETWRELTVGKS